MNFAEISDIAIKVLSGLSMIVTGATILARLTKTQKDDKVVEKIRKFLEGIGNLFLKDRK